MICNVSEMRQTLGNPKQLYDMSQREYDGNWVIWKKQFQQMESNKEFCWAFWAPFKVVEDSADAHVAYRNLTER